MGLPQTQVFVDFKSRLFVDVVGLAARIRWRVDDSEVFEEEWPSANNQAAAFAPRPETLLAMLKAGTVLHLEVTPPLHTRQYTAFKLIGIKAAIKPIEELCALSSRERLMVLVRSAGLGQGESNSALTDIVSSFDEPDEALAALEEALRFSAAAASWSLFTQLWPHYIALRPEEEKALPVLGEALRLSADAASWSLFMQLWPHYIALRPKDSETSKMLTAALMSLEKAPGTDNKGAKELVAAAAAAGLVEERLREWLASQPRIRSRRLEELYVEALLMESKHHDSLESYLDSRLAIEDNILWRLRYERWKENLKKQSE